MRGKKKKVKREMSIDYEDLSRIIEEDEGKPS